MLLNDFDSHYRKYTKECQVITTMTQCHLYIHSQTLPSKVCLVIIIIIHCNNKSWFLMGSCNGNRGDGHDSVTIVCFFMYVWVDFFYCLNKTRRSWMWLESFFLLWGSYRHRHRKLYFDSACQQHNISSRELFTEYKNM